MLPELALIITSNVAFRSRLLTKLSMESYSLLQHVIFILKEIANRSQVRTFFHYKLDRFVGKIIQKRSSLRKVRKLTL